MRLILIGTDRNIFKEGSTTWRRIGLLGSNYFNALDTIVFSTRAHGISSSQKLAENVHAYPTNSISRFFRVWDAYKIAKTLPRPDVVSSQDAFETGLVAFLIARHWHVPFVVEMHTDFFSREYFKHSFINKIQKIISDFVLKRASGAYCVSNNIKEKVNKLYPKLPVSVLPIYVDIEKFKNTSHVQHPRFKTALLWVGRMEKEKNPHLALEAFIEARKKGFDVGLTFVGEGSLINSLKSSAKNTGFSECVEFVGNQKNVGPHYAQADLLLVTSKYEGYGMVIVEALASGVPTLSTDVGVAREAGAIISEEGYISALCNWLSGSRGHGILKLHTYVNEEEYFSAVKFFYEAFVKNT